MGYVLYSFVLIKKRLQQRELLEILRDKIMPTKKFVWIPILVAIYNIIFNNRLVYRRFPPDYGEKYHSQNT